MKGVVKTRIFSFFATILFVPVVTALIILFARGYRPDFSTKTLEPTGILASTSHPDGAQVLVNGEIKTATNNSLNLSPGSYSIQIKKVGFHTWSKNLLIEKETVTQASAFLFATVPTLKPITLAGAYPPLLSPSQDKVVYLVPNAKKLDLLMLDLSEPPLGLVNREPRTVANLINTKYQLSWSPDSRQLLLQSSSSAQLLDLNSEKISEASIGVPSLLLDWQIKKQETYLRQFSSLTENLQQFLATCSSEITWSSTVKKILYTATASAVMPYHFTSPIPGSSTQTQSRTLIPNHMYTYDIEEDRNFDVGPSSEKWIWYPTGNHVYKVDKSAVIVKEYDNANETVIFAGTGPNLTAIPFPSGKQLLVHIPTPSSALPNIYTVNLK